MTIYGHEEREAEQSINFVTCHDGFTLNDLVSYDRKHNEANGENDRDGWDDNLSWNCGVEGPTEDPTVEALRNRQVKNFFALELLSAGTPMLLMGDEVRRTQRGNNNAYCQDSDISWFDWSLLERHGDIHRFVKALNRFRQRREVVAEMTAPSLNQLLRRAPIEWHGVALKHPDWSDHSHSIAFTLRSLRYRLLLHGMLNAYWEPLTFELPPVSAEQGWRRWIDTALEAPDDICPWESAPVVRQPTYEVQPRSVVLLVLALGGGRDHWDHSRFSNRPVGVKHFQAIHHCSVIVSHGLALLFGIATRPSIMGSEDEAEHSFGRPCRLCDGRSKRKYELTSSIVPRGTSFPPQGRTRVSSCPNSQIRQRHRHVQRT
jgi:isoamylase